MPKIILLTSQKGGVGKSTLTFNLAKCFAKSANIVILDFDTQGSLSQISELVSNFKILQYKREIKEIPLLPYDFIFIDTPPYFTDNLMDLIKISDIVLLPIKPGVLDVLASKNSVDFIIQANKENNAMIVLNMVKPNTTLTLDVLISLEEFNLPIAKTTISDLVAYTRSVILNTDLKDSRAISQMENLSREILMKLI
ncbi:ParA family protein [Polaribacter ponticola]|uniref:ParA family protein n=1 Tax=Polaribacter ponticola TaxID=2978475 RepID=A0ABT5SBH3_9FLAO|nr:ParA family protein [Polaribacter sp. MSW5]MDD7915478.1 ParA family protein [Polaribacter sp. MSW5]